MAVSSTQSQSTSSPSKETEKPIVNIAPPPQQSEIQKEAMVIPDSEVEQQQQSAQPQPRPPRPSPAKRTKSPVVGNGVYDGVNGKTCHQCRQKTRALVVSCKGYKPNGANCNLTFCTKCLLNRYGEKAEEVNELNDWTCPKCRGICNCSLCMKKRGLIPTGILIRTAKAVGFSSVSEMLEVQGFAAIDELTRKRKAGSQDPEGNCGNGPSSSAANIDLNLDPNDNRNRKFKRNKSESSSSLPRRDSYQEDKNSAEPSMNATERNAEPVRDADVEMKHSESTTNYVSGEEEDMDDRDGSGEKTELDEESQYDFTKMPWRTWGEHDFHIPLLLGDDLTNVAGVHLPLDDVGHALQFLEFCKAFREVLDLEEGQSESILRELADHSSSTDEGQYSDVVQFHIKLLNLIRKEMGEELVTSLTCQGDSWVEAFGNCIYETLSACSDSPSDCFHEEGVQYDTLDPSKKLRLLNFLCDESLGTSELRKWISLQDQIYAQRTKEAREKVTAAKEKEKLAKHKMKYEMTQDFVSKDAGPSSVSDKQHLISMLKDEASKAHNETLEAEAMIRKSM